MIARITLENFFSFGEPTTIELNPNLNVLVGINGSGKSNFLKAISLLQESIAGEGFEKIFLQNWGGFYSVGNFNNRQNNYIRVTFEFDKDAIRATLKNQGYKFLSNPFYEITIYGTGTSQYYLGERIWAQGKTNGTPFIFLEMENSLGVISTREDQKVAFQKHRGITFNTTELILRQLSDPDRYYPQFTLKKAIEKIAVYNYFDTTLNSLIRQPLNLGIDERLSPNGQNLMSILNRIKNKNSLDYEKIEEFLRKINPYFKEIGFDIIGPKFNLALREQYLSKTVPIANISDGTLRYLILLSICFNPERGNLVCIDEPEIGLHPDMIHSIADAMRASSKDTQLIIATHSPLFLNDFELNEILIFEKGAENQTIAKTKSEDDFENWNDNYLSGQLWLRGLIGGKRW